SFIEAFNRLLDRVVESENRLNSSKQRAEKAEKTKTSFVANMSHEIRSPLHTILGMEEIMRSGPLVGDQKRFLGLLRKAGEGLLNLINNILDISKMEAGELQIENLEFELEEILHNTGDLQSIPADKKNVEIYIDINPDLPKYFKGDAFRIKQVLMNLISNAVKFTSFGEIIIRAEWNPKSNKQQDVLFSVIDSGVGISKEKVDKLFNEYFQENDYTAREFGGTGLGLAISKALVEAMGGKIGIKSVLGKGTTFFFNIPFSSSRKLEVSEIDLNGKGLSIIDAPDKFVGLMRDYFKPTGLKIITLSSTELNLKKMGSLIGPENPHIIFQTVDNVTFVERCKRHFSKREGLLYWLSSGHPVYQEDFFYMRRPIHLSELKKVVGSFFGQSQIEEKNKEKRSEVSDLMGNILIVDDSDEGQLVMKFFLKKTKLNIDFASDGKEGISKFKEKKYDLVLMDMQMPITNGFEATKLIREFEKEKGYPRTTIIALTAYAFKDEIEKTIAAGCDDHISKPIVKSKLLNSLKRYI
ncbi:MAG: ATP-binding protein, partial [Bdellovibrionota bacterium]|nr:ATP-binding protein [Bdellovibrionota bacterium]